MVVLRRAQRTVVWFVKFTDQEPVEINLPNPSALGTQRHLITRQRFADEAHSAPPVNLSALLHPAQQPGFGIMGRPDAAIGSATRSPVLRGRLLLQSFMRALAVVVMQPALTAPLLSGGRRRRWPGGFGFEFAMPLFMRAIIRRHVRTKKWPRADTCRSGLVLL